VDGYAFQSFDTLLAYRGEEAKIDAILIQSPGPSWWPPARCPSRWTAAC
jgi:hypothetical protein